MNIHIILQKKEQGRERNYLQFGVSESNNAGGSPPCNPTSLRVRALAHTAAHFCDKQKTKQTKRNEKLKALSLSLCVCVCACACARVCVFNSIYLTLLLQKKRLRGGNSGGGVVWSRQERRQTFLKEGNRVGKCWPSVYEFIIFPVLCSLAFYVIGYEKVLTPIGFETFVSLFGL